MVRKILLNPMFIGLLVALACIGISRAQVVPTPPPVSVLGGYASLAVTSTTANVQLPASNPPYVAITVFNSGAKDAFIKQGGSSVTAATTDTKVPAGKALVLYASGTYLAAICGGSDSTTLNIYQANGSVLVGP